VNFKLLKSDVFGRVALSTAGDEPAVVRDLGGARWWARGLGRRLLAREARALAALDGVEGVPRLLRAGRDSLARSYIEGLPMQRARPAELAYFRRASALLRRVHRAGVVHNDLAKEPNWIVTAALEPAVIDFQLAWHAPRRGRLFRLLAREDLRHLLKHKRTYCASHLTRRERAILASPSWPARAWMATVKPAYRFVTRRVLGWADREGAGDR
jgi:RIO-like serine/threonine protein kinase